MPRRTTADYLEAHSWLEDLWAERPQNLGLISNQDQSYLHDYFLLSVSMSDDDLLSYRKKISADQPSLPQCAGRALKKLRAAIEAGATESGLTVRAVAHPTIDANSMGRVLAKLARDLDKQDRNAA